MKTKIEIRTLKILIDDNQRTMAIKPRWGIIRKREIEKFYEKSENGDKSFSLAKSKLHDAVAKYYNRELSYKDFLDFFFNL